MAAEQTDNDCTADRCSLLINMGVHVKSPFTSSTSAAQRYDPTSKDLAHLNACEQGMKCGEKESCRCNSKRQNQTNVCSRQGQQIGVLIAVLLSAATLLLSVCSSVYLLQLSNVDTSEIEDLRQRVQRLDALCGLTTQWPALQAPVTDNAGGSSVPQEDGFPWQQNAMSFADNHDSSKENVNALDDRDDEGNDAHGHLYNGYLFQNSRQKRSSRTKRNRNGKSKACKKLQKCIKDKENGKTRHKKCAKMLKCLPQQPAPKSLMAVHFTSDYLPNLRQKKFGRDSNSEGLLMTGEVSSTNEVALPYAEAPLHLTEEADWMSQVYKNKAQQPIVSLEDGGYTVKQSGLYYIYSSVMFRDLKPRQSQAIVVNGSKVFKCMDSVDFLEGPQKYKTCTITGVTYLNVNDRLEVQNLYNQTEIDQAKDSTYFGAILLFPFQKTP